MKYRAFVSVLLLSSVAAAQTPPIVTVPAGKDRITPLKLDEPAPYSGQLFDPPTALRWANWLKQYKLRLRVDVERERESCSTKIKYEREVKKAEVNRARAIEKDLKVRLQRSEQARLKAEHELRNPPWYRATWFGVSVGVVGTAALFGLSAWTIGALKE